MFGTIKIFYKTKLSECNLTVLPREKVELQQGLDRETVWGKLSKQHMCIGSGTYGTK